MSRQQRKQRADQLSEIVDFRFLQFHASKVPNGWDKLVVSVISLETGKAIARTNKAVVRGGSCKWLEDVSESVRFLQDDNSRELEEKLYKFVVSMGSARLGILGEATVNLADYLNSKDLDWIQLPLKKCNHGTILQVKIQCLTPRSGARESELWSETVMEPAEQISVFNEEGNESESSIRRASFRSQLDNTLQQLESKTKDVDLFSGTSHNSLNSLEELSGTDSAMNGNSKGFATGARASSTSIKNGLPQRQHSRSFGVKAEYPQNSSFDRATSGSQGNIQGGIENIYKSAYVGGLASGNGSSSEFLEAAEMTILELRKESMLWERKAQKSILETETLKQQLAEQKREHREMEMQFLTMQTERDSFKQEVDQLKSTLQGYIESKKGAENARSEAQDARNMVKEYEDEIELLKESNVNLSLNLSKIQHANEELVFALQELEETVEKQNVEIEKLLEVREKIQDVDISVQEAEEMRDYKELRVKFSDVVAKRDILKKENEQLSSSLEQRKDTQTVKVDVEDTVAEFQKDMETTYYISESQHDLQQHLETLKRDMNELERDCKELTDENLELIYNLTKLNKNLESKDLYIAELEQKLRVSSFDSDLLGEGYIGKMIHAVTEFGRLQAQVIDVEMSSKTLCSTELGMEMSICNSQSQAMGVQNHSSSMKITLNTLKERINELESELENTHEKAAEKQHLAAFSQHQLDVHIPRVSQAEEEVASPIKNAQTLELLNSNETFFINGLKVLVSQLSGKIEMSEHLGNAELADFRSLNDFQNQFKELQSQKLALEGMLNVFENRFQDLEREVITTQQEMIEREIELIVAYECRLEDNELTLNNTEEARGCALHLVQTLEDDKSKLSLEIDGLQDRINDLEKKLTRSKDSYRANVGNYANLISDLQDQVRELQDQVRELQDQKHVLQGQINVLKERIHELECDVQTAEKKIVKREEEVTADYEYKIQKTEARVINAEADLVDCLERLKCFESSRAKDEIVIDKLKLQITQLQQEINSSADVHSMQLAGLETSLIDFQNQVMKLQGENILLNNELSMLNEINYALKHEVQKGQQEAIDREQDLSIAYENRLQVSESGAKEIEDKLAESLKIMLEFDNIKHDMAGMLSEQQKQIQGFKDQTAKMQDELVDYLKTIRILEEDKERISIELSNECARRQNAENETSNLDQINGELQTRLKNIESKHLETCLQFSKLEETNLQIQEQICGYILLEKRLKENISQLEIAKMKLHSEVENLHEKDCASKFRIQDLNCQLSALMVEAESLRFSSQDLDIKSAKLQMENLDLKEKLRVAHNESKSVTEYLEYAGKLLQLLTASADSKSSAKGIEKSVIALQYSEEETESRLKETEEKCFHLFEKVHSLERQFSNITEERDSLRLELENTKASCFNHQAEMKTLELELKGETGKVQKALDESERTLSGTLEELDFCKVEQKLLEIKLENLRNEHTAAMELQHRMDKTESCLKETEEKNVHLSEQVHSLEMHLNNITKERDSFRQELENTKAICFNDQAEMKMLELQLKEENGKLQKTLHESQRKLSGILEELDSCKVEQKLLEMMLENLRKEHTKAVEHIKEETENHLKETEEKNVNLLEHVHSLKMQLNNVTEERDSFSQELENTKASCFNHQAEMKTLELELKEENGKLQKVLHELEKKLSETIQELGSCKVEQKLLEITLENLRKEHTEAMELQHTKKDTESRLKETEEKIVHLLEQLHSLEMQLNSIAEERDSLILDLQNTRASCFNHEAKMIALELELKEENGKLQQVLYESQKMLSGTLEELDSCKKERQLLEMTLENLRREHATAMGLQQIIEETEGCLKETEEKNVHLLEQPHGLEMQLKDMVKEQDSFKVDLENTNASCFNHQAKIKALELKLQQSEAELWYVKQEFKLEVDNSREKEEDLHSKLGLVHRQLEDTKFSEAGFHKRVQEMETKVDAIENEKQKVEAENINMSSHVDELMGLMVETDVLQIIIKDVSEEKITLQQSLDSTEAELGKLWKENISLMVMFAAIKEQIPEVEELKQKIAELEEKIFCLQTEQEIEQTIKSMQFQSISVQFELKLQDLEQEREKYRTKLISLKHELQLNVNTLPGAEDIIPISSDSVVGWTYPPHHTDQFTKLTNRIRELQSEFDTRVKEFEEKEEILITEIQKLEDMNQHLMQAKLDSETDQLRNELIRLQNQNSALSQKQQEVQSKLVAQELFEKEVYRLHEVNKQLDSQLRRFKETAKGGNILERVVALEAELAENLKANSLYMLQLRSFLQQEQNVHAAALHTFGSLDQIINDLVNYKRRISTLEAELNDMRERYSSLSHKLAEVEVQREELVMTIKHAKYGKRWRGKN